MFRRIYIEISNICNLSCSFCPGTKRQPKIMSAAEFAAVLERIRLYTSHIYLHVMGEPLLHPELPEILAAAEQAGLNVSITTNGVLLPKREELLLSAKCLYKVSVSLHALEGNGGAYFPALRDYLAGVWHFCDRFGGISAMRLWNEGGANEKNEEILAILSEFSGVDIASVPTRVDSRKIRDKIFLESAEKFDWPSLGAEECGVTYCHGFLHQIGILADGTVVPCCLDSDGTVALGNIFENDLESILSSPRALAFRRGIDAHTPSEELCRKCGYATRFK